MFSANARTTTIQGETNWTRDNTVCSTQTMTPAISAIPSDKATEARVAPQKYAFLVTPCLTKWFRKRETELYPQMIIKIFAGCRMKPRNPRPKSVSPPSIPPTNLKSKCPSSLFLWTSTPKRNEKATYMVDTIPKNHKVQPSWTYVMSKATLR